MEHIPAPQHVTYTPPRVPLVCEPLENGKYWDGQSWLEYAARAGDQWKHFTLPDHLHYRYQMVETNTPSPTHLLEAFLQRWLWFGMLYEAFSEDQLYCEDQWMETNDGVSYITSRTFPQVLESYASVVADLPQTEAIRRCHRMHVRLRRFWCIVWLLRDDATSHKTFNPAIRASLILLYDQLSSVWKKLYAGVSGSLSWTPAMHALGTFTEDEKGIMKRSGWCPGLLHLEDKENSSPALRRYLSQLKQYPEANHSKCDDQSCQLETTDDDYKPQHAEEGCDCEMMGPQRSAVEEILRTGNYPVLSISGENLSEVNVDIVPHDSSLAYVAISHVWAQGMGNPLALQLPTCQILRMHKAIRSIKGRSFTWPVDRDETEEGPLYLWCDSLLCPTVSQPPKDSTRMEKSEFRSSVHVKHEEKMKRAGMKHLRRVYEEAKYVLVLDKGLEQTCYAKVGPIEAAARLLTSQWSQRLWTFQEAALPVKLLVKFQDTIIDYRDLALAIQRLYKTDIVLRPLVFPMLHRLLQLRMLQYFPKDRPNDVTVFSGNFGRRRYTKEEDVPLCAGALLGLDTGTIAEAHGSRQRMVVLWQLLAKNGGVPANLIFLDIPRLNDIPGMRWAPSSFSDRLGRLTDPLPCRLIDKGLVVKLPTWVIKLNALPWVPTGFLLQGLTEKYQLFWVLEPGPNQWYKVMINGEGDQIEKFWRRLVTIGRDKPQDWRVLFEEAPVRDHATVKGLLCLVDKSQADFPILHSGVVVDVSRAVGDELIIQQGAYKNAQTLRRCQGYRRFLEVHLCDVVLQCMLRAWPRLKKSPGTRALRMLCWLLTRYLSVRLILASQYQRQRKFWSAELGGAIESLHGVGVGGDDTFLMSNTILLFHAQYATIVASLQDQECCVD